MPVPTIYQSFSCSLPDLGLDEAEYYAISASSESTATTDPPKIWEPDPTPYAQKASDTLKKLASSLRNPLPAVERPFRMLTEGDVLRATTLYVTHPINQALNAKYKNTPIYCLSENVKGGVRCDIIWKYKNGNDFHTIAVLELKRRGVLRWDDFQCAESDAANRDTKIQEAYDSLGDDNPEDVATTFEKKMRSGSQDRQPPMRYDKRPSLLASLTGIPCFSSNLANLT